MLSIGKLGAGQEGYYLDAVTKGIDEYYTVRGEVPGRWAGSGITGLGLAGQVESDALRAVLAGEHPGTGERLASAARKVWAFDLTFSAPKSTSVLFAFGGWEIAGDVGRAHEAAVDAALGYLEREALSSRRGHGGACRVETSGFVAAAFRHRTSRAGDPQLHTHVVVSNLAEGLDGRWGTLDSRGLYRHARTAGYLYQAHLRAELRDRLGVAWEPVVKGAGEIQGVPGRVLREFSQRRAQIEGLLGEQGDTSRGAAQLATLVTRDPKTPGADFLEMREGWGARVAALGFGPERIAGVLHRDPPWVVAGAGDMTVGEELTLEHSSFDRRDVLRCLAGRARQGLRVEELERAAEQFLSSPRVVALSAGRWTTPEMLRVEVALVNNALARRAGGFGLTGAEALARALDADRALSVEQARMVRRLTSSGDGVEVVVGVAGAGKTRALASATHAWYQAGYRVVGTALAARTANQLRATTGAAPFTMTRLLYELDARGARELLGSVVVVDEAAMVGTRQLARLAAHAHSARAKVVLVGDPHQLPEIEAGGAFAALARRLDASELRRNLRQHDPADRSALAHLRVGDAERAVAQLARAGRITITETTDEAREQMVADWLTARSNGQNAVMLARRRADVATLNAAARAALIERGEVQHGGVPGNGCHFAVGDRVMTRRNETRLGLTNGETGTVIGVDERHGRLLFRSDDGHDTPLPAEYLRAGHLTHAYATTIHKAQGLTADTALVLADDSLFQEAAYTALSRGRHTNRLYLVDTEPERPEERHAPEPDRLGGLDSLIASLTRSEAKELALDARRSKHIAEVWTPRVEVPDHGIDLSW
jgi:conjugative relaxase-like TrwC/TraI family protein